MSRSVSASLLGPEFDAFLFAPIEKERNGMLLSVVSALVRLDVDPWQEASALARLPGETATQRLASLIAALPDESSAHRDPGTIAARLIPLLPRLAIPAIPLRETLLRAGKAGNPRLALYVSLALAALALGILCTLADRQMPARVGGADAPVTDRVIPQASPPGPAR